MSRQMGKGNRAYNGRRKKSQNGSGACCKVQLRKYERAGILGGKAGGTFAPGEIRERQLEKTTCDSEAQGTRVGRLLREKAALLI